MCGVLSISIGTSELDLTCGEKIVAPAGRQAGRQGREAVTCLFLALIFSLLSPAGPSTSRTDQSGW